MGIFQAQRSLGDLSSCESFLAGYLRVVLAERSFPPKAHQCPQLSVFHVPILKYHWRAYYPPLIQKSQVPSYGYCLPWLPNPFGHLLPPAFHPCSLLCSVSVFPWLWSCAKPPIQPSSQLPSGVVHAPAPDEALPR